jgi:hypothetical protein
VIDLLAEFEPDTDITVGANDDKVYRDRCGDAVGMAGAW